MKMAELNLLLVKDDPDDREFFKIALKRVGPTTKSFLASNRIRGQERLDQSECEPNYIFLNLYMPLLSGKDFPLEIRQSSSYELIRVIILSTSSNSEDIKECQQLGACLFMTKMISVEKLADVIVKTIYGKNLPFLLNYPVL